MRAELFVNLTVQHLLVFFPSEALSFLSSVSFFVSSSGIFTFESASQRVSESVGVMEVKVLRTSGARGLVAVPYRTVDGTAKGGEDYELTAGKLEFQNDETM